MYLKPAFASVVGFIQYGVVDKVVLGINIPKWNMIGLINMAALKKCLLE
jgi:hypothetical protein